MKERMEISSHNTMIVLYVREICSGSIKLRSLKCTNHRKRRNWVAKDVSEIIQSHNSKML
jgi:hypothetical protein